MRRLASPALLLSRRAFGAGLSVPRLATMAIDAVAVAAACLAIAGLARLILAAMIPIRSAITTAIAVGASLGAAMVPMRRPATFRGATIP